MPTRRIAVWGLAFKPGTDDVREAPALVLIDRLLGRRRRAPGARPRGDGATSAASTATGWSTASSATTRSTGADALAIMTEWKQFVHPDFDEMRRLMRRPVIFDGRNLYDTCRMREAGFTYYSIGRPPVEPQGAASPLPSFATDGTGDTDMVEVESTMSG